MPAVLVDTDVVSYLYKKDSRARLFRPYLVDQELVISFMTRAELNLWALRRKWGESSRDRLDRHLQRYRIHFADLHTCSLWAELVRKADRRGRPIDVADAWIAASAVALGIPLVTHNARDYAGVEDLVIQTAAH